MTRCEFSTPAVAGPECTVEVSPSTLPPEVSVETLPATGSDLTFILLAFGFFAIVTGIFAWGLTELLAAHEEDDNQ